MRRLHLVIILSIKRMLLFVIVLIHGELCMLCCSDHIVSAVQVIDIQPDEGEEDI